MIVHEAMPNSCDYTVLLDGNDVTRYCCVADDEHHFVILLVPYSRIVSESPPSVVAIFPDIGIGIDSALYEKREGFVRILVRPDSLTAKQQSASNFEAEFALAKAQVMGVG